MKRRKHGTLLKSSLVGGELYNTFIPDPLPPVPAINMDEISGWLEKANIAIGELNGLALSGLDSSVLNYMYIRKEAVLSSQIEGTQSTLDDLLRYESTAAAGVPVDDVTEVSSYVAALNHGTKRILDGFPLSNRLIRETHKILLSNSRGSNKTPGAFRRSQNWLGGTRPGNAGFVPAPPEMVSDLMSDLEKFMHSGSRLPVLVKAALIHQQLETIHPFLDGNGRTGRLLITLYLCVQGLFYPPFLYLSLFFKQHRELYYEKLSQPRINGDWEDWINFFLEGVAVTADNAKKTLLAIQKLFVGDDEKISNLGRSRNSVEAVFKVFKQKPVLAIAELTKRTGLTKPTVIASVNRLISLGTIKEISEKNWNRIYSYSGYVKLLAVNTIPDKEYKKSRKKHQRGTATQ
ncbi:MAG: Fic family protein [Treponema sp.]|nr:Fic family protein [Treponema sp.]